ncbi:MAG TPA: hypothetical protein VIH00_05865, partial [Candidatus Limnocylindrales bacterium]
MAIVENGDGRRDVTAVTQRAGAGQPRMGDPAPTTREVLAEDLTPKPAYHALRAVVRAASADLRPAFGRSPRRR